MELEYSWSPFRAFFNNPIIFTDPDGLYESTHTDSQGNVIAVFNDGDNGVYRHAGHAEGVTAEDIEQQHNSDNTSAGGEKMGEIEYWDEFIVPETGEVMTRRILFGESWDGIIDEKNEEAAGLSLIELSRESAPGQSLDTKAKKEYKGTTRLLNGKYATARSAGNYLAGYNAERAKYVGTAIPYEIFQRLAGALHVRNSLSTWEKLKL